MSQESSAAAAAAAAAAGLSHFYDDGVKYRSDFLMKRESLFFSRQNEIYSRGQMGI